jgi:hypothetical protein
MEPFTGDIFKGMLAFFLLDMGMATAAHFKDLKKIPKMLAVYGVVGPLVHAVFALWLCSLFGVPTGNAILLMVLAASASYIAVPAVIKHAIPEASPLLYLGLPLISCWESRFTSDWWKSFCAKAVFGPGRGAGP